MTAQLSEIYRLLENLIRIGTVAEVDGDQVRVRTGKNVSDWLPWITLRAGKTRTWEQLTVGEQGILFSPGGVTTAAVFLTGLYSNHAPAPTLDGDVHMRRYPDGATITYDHDKHELVAKLPAGSSATITANEITANADRVTSNAETTVCTGDLFVDGNFRVAKQSTLNGGVVAKSSGSGAAVQIDGDVEATGDVKAADISLRSHHHDEHDGPQTSEARP